MSISLFGMNGSESGGDGITLIWEGENPSGGTSAINIGGMSKTSLLQEFSKYDMIQIVVAQGRQQLNNIYVPSGWYQTILPAQIFIDNPDTFVSYIAYSSGTPWYINFTGINATISGQYTYVVKIYGIKFR